MNTDGPSLLALFVPLAGVVGLFVGSFLNVVVYRTPLGLSVASPRSFCPTCERQLAWWENVPVISWVALRGRCHTCHEPISVRYPLVELTTGVTFALVIWAWHGWWISAGYCILAATVIAVALIEYRGQRAPLVMAAVGTGLAQFVIVVAGGWQHHWTVVSGSLLGTALAVVGYGLLRRGDPECTDQRGHGRSALLPAGCWVGGLGLVATAVGVGVWIAAYALCMVGAWSIARQTAPAGVGADAPTSDRSTLPLLLAPLVTAIAIGMTASLIAGG
ncbi:MAG: prepilin peptidase [Acidimicrobiales bacterium]|jgi:leader peptidase (prepilin peptidase)/N-methyltransferase